MFPVGLAVECVVVLQHQEMIVEWEEMNQFHYFFRCCHFEIDGTKQTVEIALDVADRGALLVSNVVMMPLNQCFSD